VQQWGALRTCCSAFPITTKWCFHQDVKVAPGATFTKRTCNRCRSLQKRGDVVGTFQLALYWKCGFHMLNTWKWPEINTYLYLNLATFQYIDGFGCYHFCLNRIGLELVIFFWTSSQLSLQFCDCRLLLLSVQFWDCRLLRTAVYSGLQPPTRWEPFVASTMLSRPESTKEKVEPTILSTIAIEITRLTRFALPLLLRILLLRIHVATWAQANNSGRVLDLNKIRFSHLHYILQQSFGLDLNLKNLIHFIGIWKKHKVTVWDPLPWSRYANITLNHDKVSIYSAPTDPSVKAKFQVCLYTSWGHLILKMKHSTTRQSKQKISPNLDHHWSKNSSFLCVQTNWVCSSGTQRLCKNDSDSSLKSLTVTWVESSHSVKNVTRVESSHHFFQRDSSRVESSTRVTLSLHFRDQVYHVLGTHYPNITQLKINLQLKDLQLKTMRIVHIVQLYQILKDKTE